MYSTSYPVYLIYTVDLLVWLNDLLVWLNEKKDVCTIYTSFKKVFTTIILSLYFFNTAVQDNYVYRLKSTVKYNPVPRNQNPILKRQDEKQFFGSPFGIIYIRLLKINPSSYKHVCAMPARSGVVHYFGTTINRNRFQKLIGHFGTIPN